MNKNLNLWITLIVSLLLFNACVDDELLDDEGDLTTITYAPTAYTLDVPEGFPPMFIPEDNKLTVEGVELGRFLFYDTILSGDETMACAACHKQEFAFTDGLAVSKGIAGLEGNRSSMSLFNIGYNTKGFFWDGRAHTLEEQALQPVTDPLELNASWEVVEERLRNHDTYPERFRKAFGINKTSDIDRQLVGKAIAQFERTLLSGNARFDKIFYQNIGFLTDEELNGWDAFFDVSLEVADAECGHCHNDPLFTVNDFFNNGLDAVANLNDFPDWGFGEVTGNNFDKGKFRAPTLRNIELTAPYMHDGRFETLEEVIEHYNSGGHYADNLNPLIEPLGLTEEDKQNLLLFLKTLTDTEAITNPAYSNPF